MNLDGYEIGQGARPYIIAELSASHNGSIEGGKLLIEIAKKCGADAVKFQCYTPDEVAIDVDRPEMIIKDGPWAGNTFYGLAEKAQTPPEFVAQLFKHAREIGITALCTPFSPAGVDFLETLDCPIYKIASGWITDLPLIEYAASKEKPLIISTGMASDEEIAGAWDAMHASQVQYGLIGIPILLHCVAEYPAPFDVMIYIAFEVCKVCFMRISASPIIQ